MTNPTSSRVWLITGSSTGFGRTLAEAALAQGDRVIATARDVSKIQDLEQQYPLTNCSIHFRISYKTGHILGVSLLCHEAGEVISTVQMVMQAQMPYTVLRDGVLTHPTMTEGLNLLFSKL